MWTLEDLPKPPQGRSGWPWTEASRPLPRVTTHGEPWPKISIVTPSFNQAQYLEETIRSVLLQGYPNLEYFVYDGGSTDGSVDILRRYGAFLDGWVSERDKGQSDAINKGFARCTGEVVNWLCSDDVLLPGALSQVGQAFVERPETEGTRGRREVPLRRRLRAGLRPYSDRGRSRLTSGVEQRSAAKLFFSPVVAAASLSGPYGPAFRDGYRTLVLFPG